MKPVLRFLEKKNKNQIIIKTIHVFCELTSVCVVLSAAHILVYIHMHEGMLLCTSCI